jgi:hypothetical protein
MNALDAVCEETMGTRYSAPRASAITTDFCPQTPDRLTIHDPSNKSQAHRGDPPAAY